jgi:hypothetical protein
MKQIVINTDTDTHTWLKELAAREGRTLGKQVLLMLGLHRPTLAPTPKTAKRKGAKV